MAERNVFELQKIRADYNFKKTQDAQKEAQAKKDEVDKNPKATTDQKKQAENNLKAAKEEADKAEDEVNKANANIAEKLAELARAKFYDASAIQKTILVSQALLKSYEMFSGVGRLGALFLKGESWEKWRNDVSQALCDTIILGGKQCWVSKVCDGYIDTKPAGNSLIARTPAGQATGAVHLQAEKSLPIQAINEKEKTTTQYIYKISYSITNPLNKPMTYNIQFKTSKGEVYNAFKQPKPITEGATESKLGSATIYKQTTNDYVGVCLVWKPSITTWNGKSASQFCTPISQYQGAATTPYGGQNTAPGTCNDNIKNQNEQGTDCGGPCEPCGTTQKPKDFEGF